MRIPVRFCLAMCAFAGLLLLVGVSLTEAQPGGGKKGFKKDTETVADFVKRIMAYDKNGDGRLTKEELTDSRLHGLFDRADTNKDGVVTPNELEELFAREAGGDKGGPGGEGPKGKGPKGKGPKGGFDGPPRPGQVLPPFLQETLKLTETQKKQVADLQKDVDAKLENILTEEQRQQLREIRQRGPGGFAPKGQGDGPGGGKKPKPPDKSDK